MDIFNTYAYPKLRQLLKSKNMIKFNRIMKKRGMENLLTYDKLYFPVNIDNSHWILIVVDIIMNKLIFYDSIKGTSQRNKDEFIAPIKELIRYRLQIEDVHESVQKDVNQWKVEVYDCPQQTNSSDCGVCV
mmetsp:Transcript_6939/g.6107  ORF Transcript_6939/g.6107 Transcript_6939/m.6107 type:complete len:131 (-) Transcript_6939:294-686(-)